jgi:GWxTD domain-containing protein
MRGLCFWGAFLLGALIPGAAASGALRLSLHAASVPEANGGAVTRLYLEVATRDLPADTLDLRVELSVEGEDDTEPAEVDRIFPGVPGGGPVFRQVFPVRLPPGHAYARVRVEDLRSETSAETRLRVNVPAFDPALAVSEIVLGEPPLDAGRPVFPLDRTLFGPGRDSLAAYVAVRDASPDAPGPIYHARLRIRDRHDEQRDRAFNIPRSNGNGEATMVERVGDLPPGEYRLEVEVMLGERRSVTDTWFQVGESGSTLNEEPDRMRTVLGYISTYRERILLEESPDDSLASIWKTFWTRRDPTPGTRRNEAEEEFLARVEEAERRFSGLDPGWRSDMGRIYIRFGPPDRIERFEEELFGPRTEVWTYVHRKATFTFQDVGYGRYRLAGER